MEGINVIPEKVVDTKVCPVCGKKLPLSAFSKRGTGYRNICKDCEHREAGSSERFKDVTSRELIEELRVRGYEGTLTKKIIETVKL